MRHWLIYSNLVIPLAMLFLFRSHPTLSIINPTLVIPGMLLVLNCTLFFAKVEASGFKACTFMLVGLLLPVFVGYLYSAAKARAWVLPDAEAMWITEALVKYYVGWAIALFVILQAGRFFAHFFVRSKP